MCELEPGGETLSRSLPKRDGRKGEEEVESRQLNCYFPSFSVPLRSAIKNVWGYYAHIVARRKETDELVISTYSFYF
jgi:hypothetical protein